MKYRVQRVRSLQSSPYIEIDFDGLRGPVRQINSHRRQLQGGDSVGRKANARPLGRLVWAVVVEMHEAGSEQAHLRRATAERTPGLAGAVGDFESQITVVEQHALRPANRFAVESKVRFVLAVTIVFDIFAVQRFGLQTARDKARSLDMVEV